MIKSWCGLDAFKRDPVVGKAQALTPRSEPHIFICFTQMLIHPLVWKNIEGELIADMEKRRADRLASRRKTTLTHRLESLRRFVKDQAGKFPHNQLSSLEIALCIPEVYQALDPNIQEFNVEKFFLTLHALVPQFVEDREERSRDILRSTLRKELALEESTDPFGLAVTMQLKCDRCGKSVTLDQIAQHGCTQHFPPPQHVLVAGMPVLDQEIIIHMFRWQSRAPFWISDLHCFRRSIKDAAAVVEACGFNANTTTVSSMDAAEIMLTCRNHDLYAPVMKWREAVRISVRIVKRLRSDVRCDLSYRWFMLKSIQFLINRWSKQLRRRYLWQKTSRRRQLRNYSQPCRSPPFNTPVAAARVL